MCGITAYLGYKEGITMTYDDTPKLISNNDDYGPTMTGIVDKDYYATGTSMVLVWLEPTPPSTSADRCCRSKVLV